MIEHVVCFGESLWDDFGERQVPGGAPLNVAAGLVSLGIPTRILTRVGADPRGDVLRAFMVGQGLDAAAIQTDPALPTGRVEISIGSGGEPQYRIVTPAAWDRIAGTDWIIEAERVGADPCPILIFGSLATRDPVTHRSLWQLLEHARLAIFDMNLRKPYDDKTLIEPLLHAADWVKVNEQELAMLIYWNALDERGVDALEPLARHYGLDALCLTLGAGGAALFEDDALIRQAGFDHPVVDTVGCGDAFLAAWLWRRMEGDRPARALSYACAAGALAAGAEGASLRLTELALQELIAAAEAEVRV